VVGAWEDGKLDFTLGVDVPVMTVPLLKAISDEARTASAPACA
jgi:hypothetical protein